jgi:hypothetical protein
MASTFLDCARGGHTDPVRYLDKQFTVDVPADEVLRGVGQAVAHLPKVNVSSSAPGQVLVMENWRPLWTILVAIFLFPIGLLALLVVDRATLVINVVSAGAETNVDLSGRGHEAVCDPILALFGQV